MAFSFNSNEVRNFVSAYTNFMNTRVSESVNKGLSNCVASNIGMVSIGGPGCGKVNVTGSDISVLQNAKASCRLDSENRANLYTDIQSSVARQIDDFVNQKSTSVQDFLAVGAAAFETNKVNFQKTLSTTITNAIREQTTNICQGDFKATNNGNLALCADIEKSKILLSQDASVTAITSCINRILSEAVTKNAELNALLTKVDQVATSEQKGLGGLLKWFIVGGVIAGVIIIVIMIIWLVLKSKSGGGGGSTRISVSLPQASVNLPSVV